MVIAHDSTIIDGLHFNYFLDPLSENKRINLCNSAQEYFPNKQDAEKNKARLYWKGKNENTNKRL